MGEMAELMLEGVMCQGCGEILDYEGDGPGFPQWCAGCRPKTPRGYARPVAKPAANAPPLVHKDIVWLTAAAYEPRGSSMYPGEYWDAAPARFEKLRKRGLVTLYEPHNSVHKPRAVITDAGRIALRAVQQIARETQA